MSDSDNKRIARNTMYLYIRMAVMMIVRLYTVRVVLGILGIDDYGLWTAITGFVTGFTFISPTLVAAVQRFLNFDMGKGGENLRRIFATGFWFFVAVALLTVAVLETFGLWFLSSRMTIPPGMETQAAWTFQFCILVLVANTMRMPYESVIVASERMSFYAVVCLLEAVLLLGIVFVLPYTAADLKLPAYGLLTLAAETVITLTYVTFSRRKFRYVRISRIRDWSLVKKMGSFSGWNIMGSLASMLSLQGVNVLINMYFGVAGNAAYGIAVQVHTAVFILVTNISKASSPRIVKDYAAGRLDEMRSLVLNIGKFTYLLILLLSIPAMFNIETLLHLWLGETLPPDAAMYSILTIAQVLVVSFTPPIDSAVFATGRIRNYQLILGSLITLNFLLTWVLYACGMPFITAAWVKVGVEVAILTARIIYLRIRCGLPEGQYLRRAILPAAAVTAVCAAAVALVWQCTGNMQPLLRLIVTVLALLPVYAAAVWLLALTPGQRSAVAARLHIPRRK